MIKAFTITMLLVFLENNVFPQVGGTNQSRDSLKHELSIAKDDTGRVLLMEDLANAYWNTNLDSSLMYGNHALSLAQQIKFLRGEAGALNALGGSFQAQGDYPKSFEILYRSLQISEENNYVFEEAFSFAWIGEAYMFLGDYSTAVNVTKRSQKLLETIILSPRVRDLILLNTLDIGQYYLEYPQLDSAHHYLLAFYNSTLHDKFWHPVALSSLGTCLFRQGDRKISFDYVREGIAGAILNKDYLTQAEACYAISKFFAATQQPDSSIYYAKKGVAASDSISYANGIYENSKLLTEEYEPSNLQEAFRFRKINDSVSESMFGLKKVQELQKTLAEEQHRQQLVQEEQIKKENRLKQYGFILGLAIMLLIAFILFRNNLQKKKANVVLKHQKGKVESALQELKSTQAQLIQIEKMASLGELTAGIAHEIQNPLNFVNNFSEVNKELVDELEHEATKGNLEEVKAIAKDIKENEEKINHHGKRADAIVKGMLQHSRTSTGQKEPTDINKLADEYLRLSYHGMRAKDKSFNVEMKTNFDPSIKKINIIPQDVGRVLLNLFNNAFYAASLPSKGGFKEHKPTVSVTTKKFENSVLITVSDNGNGIPQNIVDKIFQPFFTTKPTGEGTGLGLSLAYDIIKVHGGTLKVESKEGEARPEDTVGRGSEFIITLPIV